MTRKLFGYILILALCAGTVLSAAAPGFADGGEPQPVVLTPEEQAYADACGPLKVGYAQDRIPISYIDGDGQFAGVSRYILDRVSQLSGLTFEYVPLPNGAVTYDYLLNEGFALVTSVEYNEENKKANGILISEPYLSSRKVVIARSDLQFDPKADLTAALSSGSQTIRAVLNRMFPTFELVDHESISACFDAVRDGRADLTIQNQFVAEYWLTKPSYDELQTIPLMGLEDQQCFSAVVAFGGGEGTPEQDGRTLISILDKAIAAMSEDEVSSYTILGVMENQYSFTLSDFLYRYRYAAAALGISALVIVVLAFLLVRLRMRSIQDRSDAKAKDQFLSAMSHEIRTPLNGLIGLNYLMGQNLDDPERMSVYLRQSTSTARYLLSLVDDVLDMSSLRSHDIRLESAPVDLERLAEATAATVRSAMEEKGLHFETKFLLAQPWVMGDEQRIQQVLLSLLDNARKFTPSGGRVRLFIEQTVQADETVLTRAEVDDTGRGMSEQFQKQVFQSFAQELDTVSKGNQGTGLGLPISLALAKLMGGELTFTSQKDVGSSFVFTFPGRPAQPPASDEPPARPAQARRARILVAEDNELNGEIMLELLEGEGFQAELAADGRQALERFSNAPVGSYGAILMDLLMPEMDGFQAAAAIRALPRPDAATVKIIACTANSSAEDRARAQACGMDGFLTKPVDAAVLLDALSSL